MSRAAPHVAPPADIFGALEALGVEIVQPGKNIRARCPLHLQRTGREDQNPSWYIHSETGLHHCWSCHYSGNFVGLVMDVLDYEYDRARRWVRRFGLDLSVLDEIPERKTWDVPKTQQRRRVLEEVLQAFSPTPPADVMERRHVTQASVEHYGVLWSTKERGWILPYRDAETDELLGYQFKRKAVVKNWPMRLRKQETLFGIDVLEGDRIVLVESPLDAVKLYAEGVLGVLAVAGSSVDDRQMRLVLDRAKSVVIALDNDKAGLIETQRLLSWGKRIQLSVFNYGDATGTDPGDLTRAEVYRGIANAVPWWEWS